MNAFPAPSEKNLSLYGRWKQADWLILFTLLFFTLCIAVKLIHWHGLPAEDSLMLLRYASHLAAGQGITWNVGEHPVEGATDFLFLIAVGLAIKVSHLGAIYCARLILIASHLAGVASVCRFAEDLSRSLGHCGGAGALFGDRAGPSPLLQWFQRTVLRADGAGSMELCSGRGN